MNFKNILLVLLFATLSLGMFAQTNRGFSFQGYAVNPDGVALGAMGITVKFIIYDHDNPAVRYEEEQAFSTDIYGVFTAVVGSVVSTDFNALDFSSADFWMQVDVKKTIGGVYTTISDSRLLSVPYAKTADYAKVAGSVLDGVPEGTILPFAGTVVPAGYLLCDGTSLSSTNPLYAKLFAAIGTAWGSTGGSNFNVPDLRGVFLRGVDGAKGYDPDKGSRSALLAGGNFGNNVGSLQGHVFQSHTHTQGAINVGAWAASGPNLGGYLQQESTGAAGGNETRPINVYVNYIIKY